MILNYHALSHNRIQIRIGAVTDKENIICFVEGKGKTPQRKAFEKFLTHIVAGVTLMHDKEVAHKELITSLSLNSREYQTDDFKGFKYSENPMNSISRVHDNLKKFLNTHSVCTARYSGSLAYHFGICVGWINIF